MQCPFLDGTVTLPAESIVVANYNTAHLDPKEWGDDAMAFAPGRADHDRYLVWNGPFGRVRKANWRLGRSAHWRVRWRVGGVVAAE